MNTSTEIIECSLNNDVHAQALVRLLNAYIKDDMGGGPMIRGHRKNKLIRDLSQHPAKMILFARVGSVYAGLLIGFLGYSTFRVCPLLNIHDLVVLSQYRRMGIARKLMLAAESRARRAGCGKFSLEVRRDNAPARELYISLGYGECKPAMSFWVKAGVDH
jgi:ribosomal protein S18 acetylase RimI-like enzyme